MQEKHPDSLPQKVIDTVTVNIVLSQNPVKVNKNFSQDLLELIVIAPGEKIMSIVHWDRSVVSFHLNEILEDYKSGDTTALAGLGLILLGTTIVPASVKLGRPILKAIIKSGISLLEDNKVSPQPTKLKSLPTSYSSEKNGLVHLNK